MYKIITDGSCDLSTERAQELDVSVVPFYVSTDGINPVSYTHLDVYKRQQLICLYHSIQFVF